MRRWRKMRAFLPLLMVALLAGCERSERAGGTGAGSGTDLEQLAENCADPAGSDRLKQLAFTRARTLGTAEAALLDRAGAAAVARIERPVATAHDDALGTTNCRGRLVIELPPGAAGRATPAIAADVDYAVQQTRDGRLRVYRFEGEEAIVFRLASLRLQPQPQTQTQTDVAVAVIPPVLPPVVTGAGSADPPDDEPEPVPSPAPAPAAAPTPAPAPAPAAPPVVRVEPPRATPPAAPKAQPTRTAARGELDCADPTTRAERLLCQNRYLADLDRETALLYYRAFASSGPRSRARLRETRGRFIDRLERCDGVECVEEVYDDRIREIGRVWSRR